MARDIERQQIAHLTLSSALHRAGNYAAAESTLREILDQMPGNPIALNNLGFFLLERGERLEEALNLIEKAIDVDPTNPSYLDSLGWAYFKLGRFSEAETRLNEAALYDSSSAAIQEHLGDLFQKLNKSDLAVSAWRRALMLAYDPADTKRITSKLGENGEK